MKRQVSHFTAGLALALSARLLLSSESVLCADGRAGRSPQPEGVDEVEADEDSPPSVRAKPDIAEAVSVQLLDQLLESG
jgi:hypothetical protein